MEYPSGFCKGLLSHPVHVVSRSELRAKKDPGPGVQPSPLNAITQPWPGSGAWWPRALSIARALGLGTPLPIKVVVKLCSPAPSHQGRGMDCVYPSICLNL